MNLKKVLEEIISFQNPVIYLAVYLKPRKNKPAIYGA